MEIKDGLRRKSLVMTCELLGTALLIYGAIMTDNIATLPISLFASILVFGAISGGHFNPAYTLAVFIAEEDKMSCWPMMLLIWFGQFLGALLGIAISYLSLYETKSGSVSDALIPRLCPY